MAAINGVLKFPIKWMSACGGLALLAVCASLYGNDAESGAPEHDDSERECVTHEHRQFDFWVGQWDVRNHQRRPNAPDDDTLYYTGTGSAEIHPVLDGCGYVEHWEGRLAPERHVLGFSLRSWNPLTERWHVVLNWPAPQSPSFFEVQGGFNRDHADFVFDGRGGGFVRYRFSGISSGEPRWEGASAQTQEGPWSVFWRMQFIPRKEAAPGLSHGRSRTTDRCPGEEFRAFDFLLGEWAGMETDFGPEGDRTRPISVRSWSILEGCAIVDRVRVEDNENGTNEFRVRSFVPVESGWIQYTLASDAHRPLRWEGMKKGENRAVMVTRAKRREPDHPLSMERIEWRREGDRLIRVSASSTDGGETWRPFSEAQLRRR